MNLPVPPTYARLLRPGQPDRPPSPENLSLFFDKGLVRYGDGWEIPTTGKQDALNEFAGLSREGPDFAAFLKRRAAALERLGAGPLEFVTQTRLAIGLGLPHPLETGFLFDRRTGCPYLPGSSVKGLLRAAARLVQKGELEGSKDFWDEHLDRIFGPEIEPGALPRTGEAIFYDAFPTAWPSLQVDILTPHYKDYYEDTKNVVPPADWHNPVPVAFLTVASNVRFRFYIVTGKSEAAKNDFMELACLLKTALDWLGIGAKKSAGYGVLGAEPVLQPPAPQIEERKKGRSSAEDTRKPKEEKDKKSKAGQIPWSNVELQLRGGDLLAYRKNDSATGSTDLLEEVHLRTLKKTKKPLRADVIVTPGLSGFRILRVVTVHSAEGT